MFVKLKSVNFLYILIPIIIIGLVVYLRTTRPWKKTFVDLLEILKLLAKGLDLAFSLFCAVISKHLTEALGLQDFQE